MRKVLVAILPFLVFSPGGGAAEEENMRCDTGPVAKTYGGTVWRVYSCDDQETLVVLTAKGNPAAPYFFIFYKKDGQYRLGGEGTGERAFTQRAFEDLSKLTQDQIEGLIAETETILTGDPEG